MNTICRNTVAVVLKEAQENKIKFAANKIMINDKVLLSSKERFKWEFKWVESLK